jgi:peroxiredoxin Q/BCP
MPSLHCPPFTLTATNHFCFDTRQEKAFILYFYPKDNTPGCTTESIDFRDHAAQFHALGYRIFGLSRDSLKSHENFKAKLNLPFELISDPEEVACEAFDVMKLKNMYGKQVRGIERSTFIIDAKGNIIKAYRKIKVPGHVKEVLLFLQQNAL